MLPLDSSIVLQNQGVVFAKIAEITTGKGKATRATINVLIATHPMYSQFRAQYPMGSLTADLVHLQPGHYVVRAMVQVGGVTLATGLSAAASVEQAEDSARARALAVLGFEHSPYETQTHWMEASRELAQQPTARLNPAASPAEPLSLTDSPQSQVPSSDWALPEPFADPSGGFAPSSPALTHELEPVIPRSSLSTPASVESPSHGKGRRTAPQPSRRPLNHSAEADAESMPVDLSDIIAQSDVELKRLGWTNLQGRRYLEQTYNKRSRQQLTDEELLEFLHYLQSQPLPEEPPF